MAERIYKKKSIEEPKISVFVRVFQTGQKEIKIAKIMIREK